MNYKPRKPPCLVCFVDRIRSMGTPWADDGRLDRFLRFSPQPSTEVLRHPESGFVYKVRRGNAPDAPLLH